MKKYDSENLSIERMESLMRPDWEEKLKEGSIELVEEKPEFTIEELEKKYSGKVAVLDLYINDMEKRGEWNGEVLHKGGMINIDHHAPIKEFARFVSSTNLAIEWVKKNGPLDKDYPIMINHSDCDSVLSALIIRGILPPDERFGEAAIAADHTGAVNEIADLLQAVQDKRDLEFSARNLKLLLDGKSLENEAQELLKKRHDDREKVKELVEKGEIKVFGGVSYIKLDKKIESSLFPAAIPGAQVILLFSPLGENSGQWEAKIRLGMGAPAGLRLDKMNIQDFDPKFRGRWNAGSNKRAGGNDLDIEEYARFLNERIQKHLEGEK